MAPAANAFPLPTEGAAILYRPPLLNMFAGVVVVLLGVNDYAVGVELQSFEDSYREFVTGLFSKVACVVPLPSRFDGDRENRLGYRLEEYREVVRGVCAGSAHRMVIETSEIDVDRHLVDGLHLNARGAKALSKIVGSRLQEAGW